MAKKSSSRRKESALEMIDRLLSTPIRPHGNGKSEITAVEAIMLQLTSQLMAGNARAGRVLLKYQDLAKRSEDHEFELELVDTRPSKDIIAEDKDE